MEIFKNNTGLVQDPNKYLETFPLTMMSFQQYLRLKFCSLKSWTAKHKYNRKTKQKEI